MKKIITLLGICIFALGANAQDSKVKFGKGYYYMAKDSSISTKFQFRFQTLYEANMHNGLAGDESYGENLSDKMMIRRSRLKFSGHIFSPRLKYKAELGLTNRDQGAKQSDGDAHFNGGANIILDALLKWNFYKNMTLWIGQTKLPGNRERVISSANLQFVDRSLVNSFYNIDRDVGLQLRHHFMLGGMKFKEAIAYSMGEGRNVTSSDNGGKSIVGRIEWLPMGDFTKKGDYFGSDLKREEKPKLSIGANYEVNENARRAQGQLKKFIADSLQGTISTIHVDMMFKYSGFSLAAEYGKREADDTNPYADTLNPYYTGDGIVVQAGYLLKNNWEPAFRYTIINPDSMNTGGQDQITEMTLGLSKYFVGHNLKIQTDISFTEVENSDRTNLRYRFQVEMQF
jgi:hypothetical protein